MRIRAFHIDAFGLLRDVTVEGLPAGFTVFLGRNEAGKSTLLDFFRSTLTGYPSRPTAERERAYISGNSAQFGGSLQLDTEHGFLRLTRRPGVAGGVPALADFAGTPVDGTLWDRLLGGITREVYTSVYGFSLSELQSFASLTSEGVRNALYGASFGMGLRSPGTALKRLDKAMLDLFKPGGSRPLLSAALREWEDIRKELRAGEDTVTRYDALSTELEEQLAHLARVRDDRKGLDVERRTLDRRLGVWRQWEEWRLTGERLKRLESVAATFPQDGPARLERVLERRESAERDVRLASERLHRTREEADACIVDETLLSFREEIRGLAERKSSCRNALVAIPGLVSSLERTTSDMERELATLGSDWTYDRVARTERPLALREATERQASEMLMADSAHTSVEGALEKGTLDLEAAHIAMETARNLCESLPEPAADLDESARETLRSLLAGTEEAQQRLPDRERALTSARGEFNRALNHLHLRPRQNTAQTLTALSEAQEDIIGRSDAVLQQLTALTESKRLAEQARDSEEQARTRCERLKNQREDLGDPNRAALDNRRNALRRLRTVLSQQSVEESRLAEAQERIATHMAEAPGTESSPALIGIGVLLGLTGGAVLIARQFLGLLTFEITPGYVFPLELWLGYLILLAGVAFIWAGLPRKRPEADRHTSVAEQLRSRGEAISAHFHELAEEGSRLATSLDLVSAGFAGIHAADLDALEAHMERERDQCAAGERLEQELQDYDAELAELHQRTLSLETACARKSTEEQNARKRWHETLMEFGVQSVPLPEKAAEFFARVDSARLVWTGVERLEKEVAAMEHRGTALAEAARNLLPESTWPEAWAQLPQVMEAVRLVLESCRQADRAAEERVRAAEALRGAEAQVLRLEQIQEETERDLASALSRRDAARAAWQESMRRTGLEETLSPVTAREALDCMDRILALDAERMRLQDTLAQQERERDAVRTPLRSILAKLERQLSDVPDWLSLLDALQRDMEIHERLSGDKARLEARFSEQNGELRQVESVLADTQRGLDWLLHMSGATDAEDFLRKHAIKLERETLTRRREDLEDTLRLAAGDMAAASAVGSASAVAAASAVGSASAVAAASAVGSASAVAAASDGESQVENFETFLTSFAGLDKDVLESRLTEVSGRLVVLADEDVQLADTARTLQLRLEALAKSSPSTDLRMREAACAESIRTLAQEWSKHALARHLLTEAKLRFERERQPDVIRVASSIFASITDGKWTSISASLEDSSLRVVPPFGEAISPELLSRGTQEQLYLALRLAHIRNHAAQAVPLPVIMDDVLVNFDPERADRTALALAGLTEPDATTPGHQVLFFTCHPHTAHRLQQTIPGSALYVMENGQIHAG